MARATDAIDSESSDEDLVRSTFRQRPVDIVADRASVANVHFRWNFAVVKPRRDPRLSVSFV